jgi:hypothetical protein
LAHDASRLAAPAGGSSRRRHPDSRFIDALPQRFIGDRAYDADPPDAALARLGVELITPTSAVTRNPRRRMTAHSGVIDAAGRSSGVSPGSATYAG